MERRDITPRPFISVVGDPSPHEHSEALTRFLHNGERGTVRIRRVTIEIATPSTGISTMTF